MYDLPENTVWCFHWQETRRCFKKKTCPVSVWFTDCTPSNQCFLRTHLTEWPFVSKSRGEKTGGARSIGAWMQQKPRGATTDHTLQTMGGDWWVFMSFHQFFMSSERDRSERLDLRPWPPISSSWLCSVLTLLETGTCLCSSIQPVWTYIFFASLKVQNLCIHFTKAASVPENTTGKCKLG